MHSVILALTIAAFTLNMPLLAQDKATVGSASQRVRIHQTGIRQPTIGVITRLDPDTIHIRALTGDLAIPRSKVSKLEISTGIHSNAGRGLKRGAIFGTLGGAALGMLAWATEDPDEWFSYGSDWLWLGPLGGAMTGSLIGVGVGAVSHSEHWQRWNLESQPLLPYVAPHQGRIVLGLGMRF